MRWRDMFDLDQEPKALAHPQPFETNSLSARHVNLEYAIDRLTNPLHFFLGRGLAGTFSGGLLAFSDGLLSCNFTEIPRLDLLTLNCSGSSNKNLSAIFFLTGLDCAGVQKLAFEFVTADSCPNAGEANPLVIRTRKTQTPLNEDFVRFISPYQFLRSDLPDIRSFSLLSDVRPAYFGYYEYSKDNLKFVGLYVAQSEYLLESLIPSS